MKRNKRMLTVALSLAAVFTLAGCGSNSKSSAKKEAAPSNGDAVTIKKGEYIIPEDKKTLGEDEAYLALKLHIKNNGPKQNLMSDDIKLKDKDGDKIKSIDVYGSGDEFSTMNTAKLDKNEVVNGYVVFPVSKDKKYTLEVSPMAADVEEDDDITTTKVKVDTSKYKNHTQDAQKAMASYVDSVLLDKKEGNVSYDKLIANKMEDEKIEYRKVARDFLETDAFNDTIKDEASLKMIEQIQDVNRKKGSVKYSIKSVTPTTAEVTVTPTLVKLSELSSDISDVHQQVEDSQNADGDMSYDDIERAVKETVAEKFPEVLNEMPVREDDSRNIKLIKDGKKWKVDTSESDYDFESLKKAFAGSFY